MPNFLFAEEEVVLEPEPELLDQPDPHSASAQAPIRSSFLRAAVRSVVD